MQKALTLKQMTQIFRVAAIHVVLFVIRRFRNEKETEAEICPANVSGVITENAPVT